MWFPGLQIQVGSGLNNIFAFNSQQMPHNQFSYFSGVSYFHRHTGYG